MGQPINVVVKHKRGTTDKLNASTTPLQDGELVVEYNNNGKRYLKVGDGTNTWKNSKNICSAEADKWSTPRNIVLSQDLSGSAAIDGSGNVTLAATVKDDSHNHIISNIDNLSDQLTYNIRNWRNGKTYFYAIGGGQDKNWKKIFTCTHSSDAPTSSQYVACTVKGIVHYFDGSYNQGQVYDIPFQATFTAYIGTWVTNTSQLFLPATCTLDCIRIVRISTNSWELQIRQITDWKKISVQFGYIGNCTTMIPCSPTDSSNATVANNYNTKYFRFCFKDSRT